MDEEEEEEKVDPKGKEYHKKILDVVAMFLRHLVDKLTMKQY